MRIERWLSVIVLRLRTLFRRRLVEHELDEELRYHVERQTAEHVARGMTPDSARAAAVRAMGGVELRKEQVRDTRGTRWLEDLGRDLRYALRTLRCSPGFTTVVVLTLALGVGANTAVFSIVDAVLLHPLEVEEPDDLLAIYQAISDRNVHDRVSFPLYRAIAERARSFTGVAAFQEMDTVVRIDGVNEQQPTGLVSGNYFSLLGLRPQAGRLLTPADDDRPGAHPLVVLSDALWTHAFGRNPAAVGASIAIGGNPFTVIGVAPPGFRGTVLNRTPQLWVPATMLADLGAGGFFAPDRRAMLFSNYRFHYWNVIGRVRQEARARITAELNGILAQEDRAHPSPPLSAMGYAGHEVANPMSAVPIVFATALSDRQMLVRFVTILMTVVGLTLVIACVNVANLFVVRAGERTREMSLRASLGASRGRLTQQLMIESLVLALAGAGAGALLDVATVRLWSRFTLPGNIALATIDLSPNIRVLGFAAALACLTAVLFGWLPSLSASQADLMAVLRGPGSRQRGARGWLLGGQIALSLVLLVGAALFVRTMRAGLATNIGFDPHPLVAVTVNPSRGGPTDVARYYDEARQRAERLPGVSGVALSTHVPLARLALLPFAAGPTPGPDPLETNAGWVYVTPNYFDVIGVPLLGGRGFADADDARSVAIVNESAARSLFPEGHSIGRDVVHAGMHFTIVGVVRDTKYESVQDAHVAMLFTPTTHGLKSDDMHVIVRSATPEASLAALRRELASLPPYPPVRDARLVADQIDAALMPQRFGATLLGVFSLVSLAISAVGIYGLVAYGVARRRQEIGIRIALGARWGDVFRLVTSRVGAMIAIGVVLGLCGASLGSRALERFLYGITPLDFEAFLAATLVVSLAAAVACVLPARRAMRIDPMTAIRSE